MQKEPELVRARARDPRVGGVRRRGGRADAGKLRSPLTVADVNTLAGELAARAEAEATLAAEEAAAEGTGRGRKYEKL